MEPFEKEGLPEMVKSHDSNTLDGFLSHVFLGKASGVPGACSPLFSTLTVDLC